MVKKKTKKQKKKKKNKKKKKKKTKKKKNKKKKKKWFSKFRAAEKKALWGTELPVTQRLFFRQGPIRAGARGWERGESFCFLPDFRKKKKKKKQFFGTCKTILKLPYFFFKQAEAAGFAFFQKGAERQQ